MDIEFETDLNSAVDQFKHIISSIQMKYINEIKTFQQQVQELQTRNEIIQKQLNESEIKYQQLQTKFELLSQDADQLRSQNSQLQASLSNQDQELNHYQSILQSLKVVLNGSEPILNPSIPIFQSPKSNSIYPQYPSQNISPIPNQTSPSSASRIKKSPPNVHSFSTPQSMNSPSSNGSNQTFRSPQSKSSQFIYAAKDELPESQFEQMIAEINMYNRKQQTRDQTISNVKSILLPSHEGLWNMFLPMISGI